MYSFLRSNLLLYPKQFGFKKNTSTEHAILQLINDNTDAFAHGKVTLGVFIDLSKAFDTVNHAIPLQKLECYGITGSTRKWFESCLKNRTQFISFGNECNTQPRKIICGVSQGSILGPLLFLIYVNDLWKASSEVTAVMFADDTKLFISDTCVKTFFSKMNNELEKVSYGSKQTNYDLMYQKQIIHYFILQVRKDFFQTFSLH